MSAEVSFAEVTIRRAQLGDAQALATIGAVTFTDTFGHLYSRENLQAFLDTYHSVEYYQRFLEDETNVAWLALCAEGSVIGYCMAGPCGLPVPDMPANSGELCRLYLEQNHRRAGLGRAFMDLALGWLEARFEHLYVGVYSENEPAQKLYKTYGFEKVADYFFMVGDYADPEWIMKRNSAKM